MKSIDIPKILSLQDGEFIYPLPQIKNIAVHPKLNFAVLLFTVKYSRIDAFSLQNLVFLVFFHLKNSSINYQDLGSGDSPKSRTAYSREGRKQLFAVLQSARGSTGCHLIIFK